MLYPARLRFTPVVITDRTDEIVAPDVDAQKVLERNVEWVLPPLADILQKSDNPWIRALAELIWDIIIFILELIFYSEG